MRGSKATTTDEFLAQLDTDQRAALEKLRETIAAAAPGATEGLSYGLPAFRMEGRSLVAFGASAKHCALYPMSPAIIESLAGELKRFDTSKGTIRFQPGRPLPATLVRKIVRARIAELSGKR